MTEKPSTASGYTPEYTDLVRATCLFLATILGDYLDDIVIVGGIVPSLIIDHAQLPTGIEAHVGTMDLDVGLALAVLDDERYKAIAERLRGQGFRPDTSERGARTRQRWLYPRGGQPVATIDFLIPPSPGGVPPGRLQNLEPDFAAFVASGLDLAFRSFRHVVLEGKTLLGEEARRTIRVCGPGAFVVMKALAFGSRGENKDAYDLFYVLRNFGAGVQDVSDDLRPLLDSSDVQNALAILRADFGAPQRLGPNRVALFLSRASDQELRNEVVTFVAELLRLLARTPTE
jgi:hypothetical protein